jgi:hypothetical protein
LVPVASDDPVGVAVVLIENGENVVEGIGPVVKVVFVISVDEEVVWVGIGVEVATTLVGIGVVGPNMNGVSVTVPVPVPVQVPALVIVGKAKVELPVPTCVPVPVAVNGVKAKVGTFSLLLVVELVRVTSGFEVFSCEVDAKFNPVSFIPASVPFAKLKGFGAPV